MRTRDVDEAIEAVTKIYCPHKVEVTGRARNIDALLDVVHPTSQPLIELSYGAPVKIDAGNFSGLFLMQHCSRGSCAATQEHQTAEWRPGQTVPLSADCDTQLWFDAAFVQKSVRLDVNKLEVLCARWLGHPLERPLRFALRPFSEDLENIWRRTLPYLWSNDEARLPLVGAAKASLDEFLLTLLLHQHPHNYSDEMAGPTPVPIPGLVRRAERYMIENAEAPITVSDVAAELGVSLRSLQAGFRQWRATTPNLFLRQTRLQLVRDELRRMGGETNVTAVAMRYGFSHLGRFSADYQSLFGERPSITARRGRSSLLIVPRENE
jgi:AraC-like DNA-binding protein